VESAQLYVQFNFCYLAFFAGVFTSIVVLAEPTEEQLNMLHSVLTADRLNRSYETLHTESVWEFESSEGVQFTHTIVSRGADGKSRCIEESGTGEFFDGATVLNRKTLIYDGDVFVDISKVKLGEVAKGTSVEIPMRAELFRDSDPPPYLEPFIINEVADAIEEAIDRGAIVEIKNEEGDPSSIAVSWKQASPSGKPLSGITYSAVYRYQNPFAFAITHKSQDDKGQVILDSIADFALEASGRMIPKSQSMSFNTAMPFQRSYRLLDVRFDGENDFPEDEFDIKLDEGTIVWDKKHKIEFRLKSPVSNADELEQRAMQLKNVGQSSTAIRPTQELLQKVMHSPGDSDFPELVANQRSWWSTIICINIVILTAICFLWMIWLKRPPAKG